MATERQASTRHCARAPWAAYTSSIEVPSGDSIQMKAVSTFEESRNELRLSRIQESRELRRTFWRSTAILVQAISTPSVGLPPRADHTPVENTSEAVRSAGCSGACATLLPTLGDGHAHATPLFHKARRRAPQIMARDSSQSCVAFCHKILGTQAKCTRCIRFVVARSVRILSKQT